jgi:hypothetical protein
MTKAANALQDRELQDSELELVSGGNDWSFAAQIAADACTAAANALAQYLKTEGEVLKNAVQKFS